MNKFNTTALALAALAIPNIALARPDYSDTQGSGGGFVFLLIPALIFYWYTKLSKLLATVLTVALLAFCYYNFKALVYIDYAIGALVAIGIIVNVFSGRR